jgi:hypothetical protein
MKRVARFIKRVALSRALALTSHQLRATSILICFPFSFVPSR